MKNICLFLLTAATLFACNHPDKNTGTTEIMTSSANSNSVTADTMPGMTGTPLKLNGTFNGTIPCADCEGIEITLAFADSTYELTSVYKRGNSLPNIHTEKGSYMVHPDGKIMLMQKSAHKQMYQPVGNDTLKMLDGSGKVIDSKQNYTLVRRK